MKNMYQFALDVQDTCNLTGVFGKYGLCKLIEAINEQYDKERPPGPRNDFYKKHPALILYIDKMCDMMGWDRDYPAGMSTFTEAYNKCHELAKAETVNLGAAVINGTQAVELTVSKGGE